jgi:hypothetical protein
MASPTGSYIMGWYGLRLLAEAILAMTWRRRRKKERDKSMIITFAIIEHPKTPTTPSRHLLAGAGALVFLLDASHDRLNMRAASLPGGLLAFVAGDLDTGVDWGSGSGSGHCDDCV